MTVFEMIIHGPQGIGASRVDGDLNISNVQSGGGLPRRQNSLTWITNDGDQGAVYPFDVIATADELVFSNIDAVPTGLSRIMIRVLSQSHW